MIKLMDILMEYENREKEEQDKRPAMSTWIVSIDGRRARYGAKNGTGDIRYFEDRENAREYAQGQGTVQHPGRPLHKKRPKRKETVQKYDSLPLVRKTLEEES